MLRLRLLDRNVLIELHKALSEYYLYTSANDRSTDNSNLKINHSDNNRHIGLFLLNVITNQLQEEYSFIPQRPFINPAQIVKIEPIDIGRRCNELTLIHTINQSYLVHESLDEVNDKINHYSR